ncbi:MAG: phosphotransferase [Chloroflexota bacterium]
MLEKPAIADAEIVACVQAAFGLPVREVAFLPLGADGNTAVYQLITQDKKPYFLKLRSGPFKEISVTLPHFLHAQGIAELISPCPTKSGGLWAGLADYKVMLYPFIEGHDAYDVPLTDDQWRQFGAALRQVHTAVLPQILTTTIPTESYSARFRELVKEFMLDIQKRPFADPVAQQMAAFLDEKRDVVAQLVEQTELLAEIVRKRPSPHVLCHSDIHAWNLLISQDGALYIVDWDDPILAPKERDLMFIGAGLGDIWRTPREAALFYDGYGPTELDQDLLAYYRCERIIQDIAAYAEQIFLSDAGGADRAVALQQLASNFLPDGTIEIALKT